VVIAIDGPAGSGKSTVARGVADRLALPYLDTGAMYRSVAFAALRRAIDPADEAAVAQLASDVTIDVGDRVIVDGEDATEAIRGPAVTASVSTVAANPEVRAEMRRRQRAWAEAHGGGVIEGRDIGSVVFPDARLKVYLTADESERARRRFAEVTTSPGADGTDIDAVAADLARRDHADTSRTAAPLAVADGAIVIDTTGRTVDDVVAEVLRRL
jgi:cytidylate kinase